MSLREKIFKTKQAIKARTGWIYFPIGQLELISQSTTDKRLLKLIKKYFKLCELY